MGAGLEDEDLGGIEVDLLRHAKKEVRWREGKRESRSTTHRRLLVRRMVQPLKFSVAGQICSPTKSASNCSSSPSVKTDQEIPPRLRAH